MTMETTTMRRCIGSRTFGIEAHEAPADEFPAQPSQKDGLGRMCKPHWSAYTNGLRKAAVARKAAAEATPTQESVAEPDVALEPAPEVTVAPEAPTRRRTRRATTPTDPEPTAA